MSMLEEEAAERIEFASSPPPDLMKVWQPSKSYRYELRDISEQLTPAQDYRQRLVNAGQEMRMIQRLEWKWKRNLELWTRCATIVKAGYRGLLGRRYFKTVQEELKLKLLQRRCKDEAVEAFFKEEFEQALNIIDDVPKMTMELFLLKFKILYIAELYTRCVVTINKFMGKNRCQAVFVMRDFCIFRLLLSICTIEDHDCDNDVGYILALAYTMLKQYDSAFERLNMVLGLGIEPILDEIYVLHAHLCFRLHSNTKSLYSQAVSDYTYLIQQHPEDMNYVS